MNIGKTESIKSNITCNPPTLRDSHFNMCLLIYVCMKMWIFKQSQYSPRHLGSWERLPIPMVYTTANKQWLLHTSSTLSGFCPFTYLNFTSIPLREERLSFPFYRGGN